MLVKEFGPASPLLDRIVSLEFATRHLTGTGYYITFVNSRQLPRINDLNTELSDDFGTSLDSPADLVGFTLFIRDGYLSSFEGYTFGDVRWLEDSMENWLLFAASAKDDPGGR